jgi:acylphosphatase
VSGWVRNCRNGDVEAVLRGTPAACESVAEWARRGPREALVTRVDTRPASAEESALIGSGFDALPTA